MRPSRFARPVYLMLGGLTSGIVLASVVAMPPVLFFIASAALLEIAVLMSAKAVQTFASAALLIAPFVAIGAGLARQSALPLADDVSVLVANGPSVWIEGAVDSDPELHPSGALSFVCQTRFVNDFNRVRSATGRVQVIIAHPDDTLQILLPGDSLWLRGRVSETSGVTNPNGFDERAFLARRGIHSTMVVRRASDVRLSKDSTSNPSMMRMALEVRNRVLQIVARNLDDDDAAVLSSILLSEHNRLSAETKNAYERTGALHLLSVSGLQLAAVAFVLAWILGPQCGIPRRIANPIVIAIVWTFVIASGGGVAALRAAIVATIVLMAPVLRRTVADPVHSLAVAAFVLLVASPLSLYDPGFQLSFATIWILLLWMTLLEKLFFAWEPGMPLPARMARYVLVAVTAGLVAQIGSWPLVAYYFNVVSVVAPAVSVIAAPLAVTALILGLGAVTVSSILPGTWTLPPWSTIHILLVALHWTTFSCSGLPFAAFSIVSPSPFLIVVYYALLGGGALIVRKLLAQNSNLRFRVRNAGLAPTSLGGGSSP